MRATWCWMVVPLSVTAACTPDVDPIGEVTKSPAATVDAEAILGLAAMPLACIDRPHAHPAERPGYLDVRRFERRTDYEEVRAFYGCWDWHSAVNSTWTLVRILKDHPEIRIASLIREKLRHHLTESALAGELEFFEGNPTFERPYGYAWLMVLHLELLTWDDPDARLWAERLAPLTTLFADRMLNYLEATDYPRRIGTHHNTAFALNMMLPFAERSGHVELTRRIREAAAALFGADEQCPTAFEPSGSDFLSPCLEEARLMSMVLAPDAFSDWLSRFLPHADSASFASVRTFPTLLTDSALVEATNLRGAQSHLIGLAFTRAEALLRIAERLPPTDARVSRYRRVADDLGEAGFAAMFDADYEGTHWIGSFALRYLVARPVD